MGIPIWIAIDVKNDLLLSGFVPKAEKSLWFPTRCLVWLGTLINSETGVFMVPQKRLDKLITCISDIRSGLDKCETVHVKKVASLVGQIVSMSFVIGNVAYIMTKCLSFDINQSTSWNGHIMLSELSREQIAFWAKNISELNKRHFNFDQSCQRIVYSDASDTGYGGYVVETSFSTAHGMWASSEKENSSTWKELMAVKKVLLSLVELLHGKRVKWFTDNTNVVSIVNKGSMKMPLQQIALEIFEVCLKNCISIDIEWIPRTGNEQADYISRITDSDDWGISQQLFETVDSRWGPHDVDWFASDDNYKVPVFWSRFWNVRSSGVDAFTVSWHEANGLYVPPVCLISRVLKYMSQCGAVGTLIVPLWRSASFWPIGWDPIHIEDARVVKRAKSLRKTHDRRRTDAL